MKWANSLGRRLGWALALILAGGCSDSGSSTQTPWQIDIASLVPVRGVVTLNGQPLEGAVVAFMNASGIPGVGETNKEGRYQLETASQRGALPGEYKVTISYMISPEGKAQGLAARSALVQSPAMMAAVEQLPPEYSDLKQTGLAAKFGEQGGAFDFELKATIVPPKPRAAEEANPSAEEAKPKTVDSKKDETPQASPLEKDASESKAKSNPE